MEDKTITVINNDRESEFFDACTNIYNLSKISRKTFCGVDFEFNTDRKTKKRYIALMQIIFIFDSSTYFNKTTSKPVFVLNPHNLSEKTLDNFVQCVLCSKVIKIFHGSDSLDYPHLFTDIIKNKKQFVKFVNYSVDTRFLCEITRRLKSRLNIEPISKRCSIYHALINNKVIDEQTFHILEKESSKINYNKDWIIDKLTPEQIKYSVYDVIYLYDLLHSITNQFTPTSDDNCDVLSLINRLYRFHMLNKLGLLSISSKAKNVMGSYGFNQNRLMNKLKKEDLMQLDQKIMELEICTVKHELSELHIYLEDVLDIDTLRKNILNCLRVYRLNKSEKDIEYLDKAFESKTFRRMKGYESILGLIDIVKKDTEKITNNVQCGSNTLLPKTKKIKIDK